MGDPWTPEPADEQLDRVASRLFFLFASYQPGPNGWERLSERSRESWREAARQVKAELDRDA